jgi:hypothetical protein
MKMRNKFLTLFIVFFFSGGFCFSQIPELIKPVPDQKLDLLPDNRSKFKYERLNTKTNRQDDGFSDAPEFIENPKKWISKPASLEAKSHPIPFGSEAKGNKSTNNSELTQPTDNYSNSYFTDSSIIHRSSEIISDNDNKANKLLSKPAPLDDKNRIISFDWEKANADRFVNSPCFRDLGFDPRRDSQELERIYKECEDAKSKRGMEKNLKVGFGILLVVSFFGGFIYRFKKSKINLKKNMWPFKKLVRADGFYAGNIFKTVDSEQRYFVTTIQFVGESIIFNMEQVDKPVQFDDVIIQALKDNAETVIAGIQNGEITQENSPRHVAKYEEVPRMVRAEFDDGSDTVKLILVADIFGGVLLYVDLEGYQIDQIISSNSGFKKRRVIDGAIIKFFHN